MTKSFLFITPLYNPSIFYSSWNDISKKCTSAKLLYYKELALGSNLRKVVPAGGADLKR